MEIPAEVDGYPVTSIYYQAFERCGNLVSAIIPEGVTSIDNRAFWGCRTFKSLTVPNSVTIIGKNAFKNCNELTIHCKAGSEAEKYAKANGIKYIID